ncbi:MAG: hypothetical protein PWQ06_2897 [Anaerophaga sp.]|nr:hypothetical protein [Anaerophaga sp.]
MNQQRYFLNPTLFNYQLIVLKDFEIFPLPKELKNNSNITIKVKDENGEHTYNDCHIDDTVNRRLRLPYEVITWIKNKFPFSDAYFSSNENAISVWKKKDIKDFDQRIKNKKKLDIPAEYLLLSWEAKNGEQPYLLIQAGFQITEHNAEEVLSAKAMATVLPYIFSSVRNISYSEPKIDGIKCYIIDKTTDWLPTSEYKVTEFAYPGIYILRRKEKNSNQYFYYVGKAIDIKKRVIFRDGAITHPNEKDIQDKQYDDICCVSINLDGIKSVLGISDGGNLDNNPTIHQRREIDSILYAVEDFAIHTISMILKSEGKKLDNTQYRKCTSGYINKR